MTVWGRHGSMLTGSLFSLVFGGLEYQENQGKYASASRGGQPSMHISGENGSLKWSILFQKEKA